jgi:hypothetical protein
MFILLPIIESHLLYPSTTTFQTFESTFPFLTIKNLRHVFALVTYQVFHGVDLIVLNRLVAILEHIPCLTFTLPFHKLALLWLQVIPNIV